MAPRTTATPREALPIAELLETLELLVSQARAYERALATRQLSGAGRRRHTR